jgi:uncharacterized protein (TIGR02452 family)
MAVPVAQEVVAMDTLSDTPSPFPHPQMLMSPPSYRIDAVLKKTRSLTDSTLYIEDRRSSKSHPPRHCLPDLKKKLQPVQIRIAEQDTFDCAIAMLTDKPGKGVCVLNMANAHTQGGAWLRGASAQEEQLCCRSTLSRTLRLQYYPFPGTEKKDNRISVVYSPDVRIFRTKSPHYTFYEDLQEKKSPEKVAVISAAALNLRGKESPNGKFPRAADRGVTKDIVKLVLRVAAIQGEKRLVLGALGCGSFQNPPGEVAAIFREVFEEEEFRGRWLEIVFAILPYKNNVEAFSKELNGLAV